MLDKIKLCINCNNAVKSQLNEDIYYCKATEKTCVVTGKPVLQFCSTARTHDICGQEAKLYDDAPF
jgi:hypothetical protein